MKMVGRVEVPQEAFIAALSTADAPRPLRKRQASQIGPIRDRPGGPDARTLSVTRTWTSPARS